jgi:hypothetical protein
MRAARVSIPHLDVHASVRARRERELLRDLTVFTTLVWWVQAALYHHAPPAFDRYLTLIHVFGDPLNLPNPLF